jgi:hypothetical protein
MLNNPDTILGDGGATGVPWAGWLELLLAFACIGTALAPYPITRHQSTPAALGFLAARVLEAAMIVLGVIAMLWVVTLQARLADTAGAATATMFGVWDQVSINSGIAAAPIALWELSLGIWLGASAFRPQAAIVALTTVTDGPIEVGAPSVS